MMQLLPSSSASLSVAPFPVFHAESVTAFGLVSLAQYDRGGVPPHSPALQAVLWQTWWLDLWQEESVCVLHRLLKIILCNGSPSLQQWTQAFALLQSVRLPGRSRVVDSM